MSRDWSYGICGCFDDARLCCWSFFLPCGQEGYNAEYYGENCALVSALSCCLLGLMYGPVIRNRLRVQRDIKGSITLDVLNYALLPCCSIMQEAREIEVARSETTPGQGGAGAEGATNAAYVYDSNPTIARQ